MGPSAQRGRLALLVAGLCIPGAFLFQARLGADAGGDVDAARLSSAECRKLYEHELQVALRDPLNPYGPAFRVNKSALESDATRREQEKLCMAGMDRVGYECRMKAESLRDLLACRDGGADPDKKTDPEGDANGKIVVTNPEKNPLKIDADNCKQGYAHLLKVYADSEELKKRPDRDRLLRHWQSTAARDQFHERCLKAFRPSDLSCIMRSSDTTVIQACLLRVRR